MIERLKIFEHENHPPLFQLEGVLTEETFPTLIINLLAHDAFILDLEKISLIDEFSVDKLVKLSKMKRFIIWNAIPSIKDKLQQTDIQTEFLPPD